jgi:hypothetical protein
MSSITGTLAAVDALIALLDRARGVSELIKNARAEGRDVSEEELDALSLGADQAIADARAAANRIPGEST